MVETLDLFDGQLSLDDIKNSTYKELGYLRKHREALKLRRSRSGEGALSALSKLR